MCSDLQRTMKLRSSAPTLMKLRTRIIHKTVVPSEAESSGTKDKGGKMLKRKILDENVDDKVGKKKQFDRRVWDEKSGERLTGVGRKGNGKFISQIHDPFKKKIIWLGTFDTPEEASSAYRCKKSEFETAKGFQWEEVVPMECDDGEFSGDQSKNFSGHRGEDALEDSPCQTRATFESSSHSYFSKESEIEISKGVQREEVVEKVYDDGEFSDNQSHKSSMHKAKDVLDSPCQTHAAFESSEENIASESTQDTMPSPGSTREVLLLMQQAHKTHESTQDPLQNQTHEASESTQDSLPSSNQQHNSSEPNHEDSYSLLHDRLPSPKQKNAASESNVELPLPNQTHKTSESTQDPFPSSSKQHKSSELTHQNSDSSPHDLLPSPNYQTHASSESTHEPLPLPNQTHKASESTRDPLPSSNQPDKASESTHENLDSPHQTRTASTSSSSHKPTPSSMRMPIVSVQSQKYKGGGAMGFLIPNPTRLKDNPRAKLFLPVIDNYGFLLGKFSKLDYLSICNNW